MIMHQKMLKNVFSCNYVFCFICNRQKNLLVEKVIVDDR